MNADTEFEIQAQVNTIHRAKEEFEPTGFKPVQHSFISKHFRLSLLAMKEEQKILKFTSLDSWPRGMKIVKENLLRSSLMDKEVESNNGNELSIITPILKALKLSSMKLFERLEVSLCASQEGLSDPTTDQNSSSKKHPSTTIVSKSSDKSINFSDNISMKHGGPDPELNCDAITENHGNNPTNSTKKVYSEACNYSIPDIDSSVPRGENDHKLKSESEMPKPTQVELEKLFLDEDLRRLEDKVVRCFNLSWQDFLEGEWSN